MSEPPKLRLGISACLLGQEVRYNGGHKRDAFLTDTFGRYVEWVAVCPEVEVGMGTPRPPIRLERRGGGGPPLLPPPGGGHHGGQGLLGARRGGGPEGKGP